MVRTIKQSSVKSEVEMSEQPIEVKKLRKISRFMRLLTRRNLMALLFVLLIAGLGYYAYQYHRLAKSPDIQAKEKTAEVIKQIAALAVVPNDPNAVLATVSDVTKLKEEHFFDNAQNGDYIVLFPSVMRAVLYRPSIDKIVNIGPLSSGMGEEGGTKTGASETNSASKTPATKTPAKR